MKITMQFLEPLDPNHPIVHLMIGRTWMQGLDDLHVQFDGPGADNFFPKYDEAQGCFVVTRNGSPLKYKEMVFQSAPDKGSVELSQEAMEHFWISPNRPPQPKRRT